MLWESTPIVRYLSRRYGTGSLCPEDPEQAALADQWMEWFKANVFSSFIPIFFGLVRVPKEQSDPEKIAEAARTAGEKLKILDCHLEGRRFVVGDHLTMGDIPVGTWAFKYFTLPIERPSLPQRGSLVCALVRACALSDPRDESLRQLAGGMAGAGESRSLRRPPRDGRGHIRELDMSLYKGMDAEDSGKPSTTCWRASAPITPPWSRRFMTRSAAQREASGARVDLAYGDGERDKLDFFSGGDADAPVVVYMHGGYWQRGDKSHVQLRPPRASSSTACRWRC